MPSTRTTSEIDPSEIDEPDSSDSSGTSTGSGHDRPTAAPSPRSLRLEYVGAALTALWVSRQFWLPGHHPSAFDTVAYSGPNLRLTVDAWRRWSLPLWNDTIFGGVPHLGNPQVGALYPPKLLAAITDPSRAIGLLVALHLVVLACGMVALVQRLGCRPPSGFVAAAIVTANGAVITRATQFEQILVLAWAPLLLFGITALLTTPDGDPRPWRAIAGTAAVISLLLLAGHPQITSQLALLALVWTVALSIHHRARRRLVDLGVAMLLGAMVAAPQLVAAASAARAASLSLARNPDELRSPTLSAAPDHLLQIVWGSMRSVDEAAFAGGFESIAHVGMAATVVALIGLATLWSRGNRAMAVSLATLVFIGIVWALGPRTPLFDVAFDFVPGFDAARVSSRWFDLSVVAVAVAAAFGVDAIGRGIARSTHVALAEGTVGLALAIGFGSALLLPDRLTLATWVTIAIVVTAAIRTRSSWAKPGYATAFVVAIVMLELALLGRGSMIDSVSASTSYDDVSPGPAGQLADVEGLAVAFTPDGFGDVDSMVRGMRPNANALIGVRSLDGYDGGVQITKRWVRLIERVSPDPRPELPLRNNLPVPFTPAVAADLSVRWVLIENARDPLTVLPGWTATPNRDELFSVWENPAWRGSAFATSGARDRALTVQRHRPERVVIDLGGSSPGGELVALDRQFDTGWIARVDGRRTDTVVVDDFFMGVEVPAGARTLKLEYRPPWLLPSLVVAITGLLGVAAVLSVGRRTATADGKNSSGLARVPMGGA